MLILAALLYKYITNNADGLIMYMLSLAKDFPDAPVVPFFLGSDINEQAHADARLTQYAGRRTNLDAITLVQGMGGGGGGGDAHVLCPFFVRSVPYIFKTDKN